MHNPNSIAPDTVNDNERLPSVRSMSDTLYAMGNVAKDSKTALAMIALGAPSSMVALRLAVEAERFFNPHLPGTSYRMTFAGPNLLEIVAQTAQTDLTPEQRRTQLDLRAS